MLFDFSLEQVEEAGWTLAVQTFDLHHSVDSFYFVKRFLHVKSLFVNAGILVHNSGKLMLDTFSLSHIRPHSSTDNKELFPSVYEGEGNIIGGFLRRLVWTL